MTRFVRGPVVGAAALGLTAMLAACGDDLVRPRTDQSYGLVLYDGAELPQEVGVGLEVVEGSLRFESDGRCVHRQSRSLAGVGVDSLQNACTWQPRDSTLLIDWDAAFGPMGLGDTASAVVRADTLELRIFRPIACFTGPCPLRWTETYVLGG